MASRTPPAPPTPQPQAAQDQAPDQEQPEQDALAELQQHLEQARKSISDALDLISSEEG